MEKVIELLTEIRDELRKIRESGEAQNQALSQSHQQAQAQMEKIKNALPPEFRSMFGGDQ